MTDLKEMVDYIFDGMSDDARTKKRDYKKATAFLLVEIASLIQDSHNDGGQLLKQAEKIMVEKMHEDND